jgi:ABC-type multidrug transport system ATPase subunit
LIVDNPLSMSWQDINVSSNVSSRNSSWFNRREQATITKQLLFNVSGHATPGKIVAIMGSSGAGIDCDERIIN